MKTYYLSGSAKRLAEVSKGATYSVVGKERAVMVFPADATQPPSHMVVESFRGNSGKRRAAWAQRTLIDELQSEFIGSEQLATPKQRAASLSRFRAAMKAREAAQKLLDESQTEVYEASKDMVRVFGRACVEVDGETYDVSSRRETVFYIRRSKKGQ